MKRPGLARRTVLRRLGSVGLLAAGGIPLLRPRISVAVPVTLQEAAPALGESQDTLASVKRHALHQPLIL